MSLVVYRITNLRNKRVYIGSTGDFETRKAEHLGQLRTSNHCNRFLQIDFNDFKESAFVFEVIADGFKSRERMLLKEYELILKTKGYNYNIDTNCPVVLPKKEGKGKWKAFKKPFVAPDNKKAKLKRKEQFQQDRRKFKVNDHTHLDTLIERKELRNKIRGI